MNGTTSALSAVYPMVVGTTSGDHARGTSTSYGTQGVDSSGFSVTAIGGGRGGAYYDGGVMFGIGGDGGSGGGGFLGR